MTETWLGAGTFTKVIRSAGMPFRSRTRVASPMMVTTAVSDSPAFQADARVVGLAATNCASPPWKARMVSAPEFSTFSLTSTPRLVNRPFSTATNSGTWFMLLTVAITTVRRACPEAPGPPAPRRRPATARAAARVRQDTTCIAPASAPLPEDRLRRDRLEVGEDLRLLLHRLLHEGGPDGLGEVDGAPDPPPLDHRPLREDVGLERVLAEPRVEGHVGDGLRGRGRVQPFDPPGGDEGRLRLVVAHVPGRLGEPADDRLDGGRVSPDEVLGGHQVEVVPQVPPAAQDDVAAPDLLEDHGPVGLPRHLGVHPPALHDRDMVGRGDVHEGDPIRRDALARQHCAEVLLPRAPEVLHVEPPDAAPGPRRDGEHVVVKDARRIPHDHAHRDEAHPRVPGRGQRGVGHRGELRIARLEGAHDLRAGVQDLEPDVDAVLDVDPLLHAHELGDVVHVVDGADGHPDGRLAETDGGSGREERHGLADYPAPHSRPPFPGPWDRAATARRASPPPTAAPRTPSRRRPCWGSSRR